MPGLWRSVCVLLWKNWRIKQRESRLNRGRTGRRWLFPALVTDIILPLGFLLVIIQKLCQYNAQLATPSGVAAQGFQSPELAVKTQRSMREMASLLPNGWGQPLETKSATLLLAALPLLLEKSNQSLAVLERQEAAAFLNYLDREYPAVDELGISSYSSKTKMVPFGSGSNEEADQVLLGFPKKSGLHIYAGLDVRRGAGDDASQPLELLTLFYQKRMRDPAAEAADDQLKQFFAKDLEFNGSSPMHFPNVLPFEMALNNFIRANSSTADDNAAVGTGLPSPIVACQAVGNMLKAGNLRWTDFPASSPLGRSFRSCRIAVEKGSLSTLVKRFLTNLVNKAASSDELDNLSVGALPSRPTNTVSGPLESNIVFYMAYLFLWPYVQLVRDIVTEKEKQLKEYLLIMGLAPMSLLVSWFLLYFIASAVVSLLGVWLLSGSMFAATTAGNWYFFLLLITFVTSMLLFGIAVTPIFSQTKTAAASAPLMYLLLSAGTFIRSLVGEDMIASSTTLAFGLAALDAISSPVVFMSSLHDVLAFDTVTAASRPVTWSTVATPCRMMGVQSLGYLLLGWYLENVFPRTHGVQQKWYFVFLPSYWCPKSQDSHAFSDDEAESVRLTEMGPGSFDDRLDDTLREQSIPDYLQHFRPTLFVRSLTKTYPNGKEAVKNVSFGVRKGEIFGLLGPNGAGKSTTLSILCGMLSPTSGDAYVGGSVSVATNPQAVRQSLSVCFQQNILFDELTVWDHLSLVCALKTSLGIKTVAEEAWRSKLQQFGLDEKRDALSKTLSGGQKRKLSLVLALLDTSRVVLLDEPTAGMDLKARLDTWDALKRAVSHRAVILTTHSMHEAQALCENIGIVADGKLKCCGSSLFLRNRFGVGYKLTVVHHEDLDQDDEPSQLNNTRRQARAELLMTTLKKFVPNASIVSDNKWETRIQLNDGEERRFAELFGELERMKQNRTIKRYAIAATDLEDVFVKVTEGENVYYHAKDDIEDAGSGEPILSFSDQGKPTAKMDWPALGVDRKLPRWKQSICQLRALIIKRIKMMARDKKALFAQYVWPIALFAILMAVIQHLAASGGSIETITTLPPSAKEASLLVSSSPKVADSVADIVAQFDRSSNPIVFDSSVTTEQAMLNAIARENSTTFFAGVFVSGVNWTSDTLAESTGMTYSLYYNETVRRSLPVTLQWITQAYCKALVKHGGAPDFDSCNLVAKRGIFPIDITIGDDVTTDGGNMALDPDETINVVRRIMVAFYLLVTMSSIVSYYIAPVVKEKENGLKRLQFMHLESENASFLYWASNFLFDYTAYTLAIIAMVIVLAVFSASLTTDILAAWLISMVLFGLAILPFLYVCSLLFSSHSSAQSYMAYVSLFQIMAASIVFALSMVPGLCVNANTIAYFLQVLPLYTFGVLTLNIVTVSWAPIRQQCLDVGDGLDSFNMFAALDTQSSVWEWDVTGSNWFVFVASAIAYALLLLLLDQKQMYPTVVEHKTRRALRWMQHRFLPCWGSHGQGYMEAEQTGVTFDEENPNTDMVRVLRVSKIFNPRKKNAARAADEHQEGEGGDSGESATPVVNESGQVVALDDVSFSVEKSDCVALLGVNGSGKSTMFEILTAGTAPTTGKALIDKCDVTVEPQAASASYGYCPQGNIFFSEMSVREHLELFYRLRCRRRDALLSEAAIIDALMKRLDLFPVEKTAAGHLSGGNKRRLMLALALLSDHTSLLLLDEPSAGVDVVARRLMWRVLREKRESQHRTSCLFTTHSMEEAEAVCANAVVLFKGKLVWCGSIPDLKQRVSRGISISVRLDSTAIWKPQQVQFYTEQIQRLLESRPSPSALSTTLEHASLPLRELEDAWELCHGLLHKDGDAATSAASRQHAKNWLGNLRSRFESDDSNVVAATNHVRTQPTIPVVEFVQEWLVQEAFVRLETQLFKEEISSRSGEPVSPVDLETARGSGSNTSGVYETSCTDKFGLADAFALMEDAKPRFHISHYSISEMSLERVFEQFT
ncbi:ABC transporter [Phytophthora boehmeriae]|uniref:ABC transporter n=1 Tax=Phytophthora boehmeriae TaxID=109152 RepID=A0A8T1WXN7_9STRA|nr:ABC transporter [Phytophthora boehmeriae]